MKRYLEEDGTALVLERMAEDDQWCASALAFTEAQITLCHTGLSPSLLDQASQALRSDWAHLIVVPVDDRCLARSREIGCAQKIRTLDAIHLAAAERIPAPARFLTFDVRQYSAAASIGLDVIDVAG